MDECLIESTGYEVGAWHIPPFALRRRQFLTLRLPTANSLDEKRLKACLVDHVQVPGLSLHGKIRCAMPAAGPTGWRSWLSDWTPRQWLKKNTPLSEEEIQAVLFKYRMDGPIALRGYAGNSRAVLGLIAAYAHKPDAVVFSTVGLDPTGVGMIYRLVSHHLTECAAIYLAFPFIYQQREQWDDWPSSVVVPVNLTTGQAEKKIVDAQP